ncbi:MAG: helix-turn-helix domain-containing protein [Bacteroidetes bacterium]|nr:helix-turn-helix domain-containing protein [Bacteroidota bacterium]
MKKEFGEEIRALREKQNLYLRDIAPRLNMDVAQLSKIENGIRQLKRKQIPVLAEILDTNADALEVLWLADQLFTVIKDEKFANEAIHITEKKLKYINRTTKAQ